MLATTRLRTTPQRNPTMIPAIHALQSLRNMNSAAPATPKNPQTGHPSASGSLIFRPSARGSATAPNSRRLRLVARHALDVATLGDGVDANLPLPLLEQFDGILHVIELDRSERCKERFAGGYHGPT